LEIVEELNPRVHALSNYDLANDQNTEGSRATPSWAWLFVLLLMPVALLNYLDRQMMATMRDSVMESIPEFGQADNPQEMWGIMLGQFKWVYAVFSLIGGAIADRFSRRWTICGSLFAWSAITWWTGQVTSYQELLMARSLRSIWGLSVGALAVMQRATSVGDGLLSRAEWSVCSTHSPWWPCLEIQLVSMVDWLRVCTRIAQAK